MTARPRTFRPSDLQTSDLPTFRPQTFRPSDLRPSDFRPISSAPCSGTLCELINIIYIIFYYFHNLILFFWALKYVLPLLPFGLFTTQIPYVILGVIYLLYIGMSFLNGKEQDQSQTFTVEQEKIRSIEFIKATTYADLPVIEIRTSSAVHSVQGYSPADIPEATLRIYKKESQDAIIVNTRTFYPQTRVSFEGFSRPPPVTA